ncbi:hypothetical protein CP981_25110 [Streptomyces platensis]|uniref:Membrane protein YndG n=1 Tax=Streptomyces platensis TaxID=58346 RepID=A0AAE6NMC7_STRPT|nr:hypothetical protein [Streptomyces platensis]OSY41359.1 hypothetical protein BG653_05126 [Streptomyces platensis]QEV54470.1 hypothetical protein CP981_25110 [Streptomyces platensis]
MGLYVEARIRAGIDEVWDRSQLPDRHQRWDLRFSEIDYLPCEPGEPQRFRYATRVLPLLTVDGTGVSAGERNRPDGTRTSALRFASAHPLSLIEEGRGYWRYVPDGAELRFLTGYDYRPRWGRFGRFADRLVFRPLMGWATAWSFDRLRLWCERGITPERSLRQALAELFVRIAAVVATAALAPVAPVAPAALLAATVPAVAAAALLLPPLPTTPAARRCLRRPLERAAGRGGSAAAPTALLATLEQS